MSKTLLFHTLPELNLVRALTRLNLYQTLHVAARDAKNTEEFRFLRAASLAHLKGSVGLILAKVLLDRITRLVICRGAVSPLIVRGFAQFVYV
jgi:hypothetical protein